MVSFKLNEYISLLFLFYYLFVCLMYIQTICCGSLELSSSKFCDFVHTKQAEVE